MKLILIPIKIEAQTRFSLPLSAAEQPPNEVRFAEGEHTEATTASDADSGGTDGGNYALTGRIFFVC